MARYSLNLPVQLKRDAEQLAAQQDVSLNQFILWAVSEKVGELSQQLNDPAFPHVIYRRGAGGVPQPYLRGTGIRVQTIAIAARNWRMSAEEIAGEYGLSLDQVNEALAFYAAHRIWIDSHIDHERSLEPV